MREYQPDIIGFQEVFSTESLKELVTSQGYGYFEVVDQPEVIDDFIYKRPVVAIASRYPIVDINSVKPDTELAQTLGLTADFSFSRQVLRAINIDTHSLKIHSAITQSSKNEKVVLIDGIEGAIRLFYVKQPVSL